MLLTVIQKNTNYSAIKLGGGEHKMKRTPLLMKIYLNVPRIPSSLSGEAWALTPTPFGWTGTPFRVRPDHCWTSLSEWDLIPDTSGGKTEAWRVAVDRVRNDNHMWCDVRVSLWFVLFDGTTFYNQCESFWSDAGPRWKVRGSLYLFKSSSGNHGHSLWWQIVLEIFSCTKVSEQLNSEHSGCEFMCAAGIQSRAFIRLELALSVCYRACLASPNWSCFVCRWC